MIAQVEPKADATVTTTYTQRRESSTPLHLDARSPHVAISAPRRAHRSTSNNFLRTELGPSSLALITRPTTRVLRSKSTYYHVSIRIERHLGPYTTDRPASPLPPHPSTEHAPSRACDKYPLMFMDTGDAKSSIRGRPQDIACGLVGCWDQLEVARKVLLLASNKHRLLILRAFTFAMMPHRVSFLSPSHLSLKPEQSRRPSCLESTRDTDFQAVHIGQSAPFTQRILADPHAAIVDVMSVPLQWLPSLNHGC